MITDERIVELKIPFGELPICDEIIDFARALLAEVSLQDMLKREEVFINDNIDSFNEDVVPMGYEYTLHMTPFSLCFVFDAECFGKTVKNITWKDYYNWKKTILNSGE